MVLAASATFQGKSYLLGGVEKDGSNFYNSLWVYSLESDSWQSRNDVPFDVYERNGLFVLNDSIHVLISREGYI